MATARDETGNWVRLEAGYFRNRKARAAGLKGRALDIAGICWSGDLANLTDGKIPKSQLSLIAAEAEVPPRTVNVLVETGRWLVVDGGWQIHDYAKYNRTRAQVEAQREKWRNKKRSKGDSPGETEGDSIGIPPHDEDGTRRDGVTGRETDDLSDRPAGSVGRQELAELAARRLWPRAQAAKGIDPMRMNAWITGTASNMLREREADIVRARATGMTVAAALELLTSIPAPNHPSRPAFYIDQDCQICEGEGLEPLGNNTFAPCPCRRSEPYETAPLASVSVLGGIRKGAAS